jgi:hypothetical protein
VSSETDFKLGFSDENGDFLSFDEIAKSLPQEYQNVDENGLPPISERAAISEETRFYDLFQVIEILEADIGSKFKPSEPGWYWVTYFSDPSTGCAHIGPFPNEAEAVENACSRALPINDPRRKDNKFGLLGGDIYLHCIIGKIPDASVADDG